MKFATIAALAAASFAVIAADAPCSDKLTNALTAAASNQAKCKTDSGFDITAEVPKAAVLTKFCASQSCVALWKTVKALGLSECMIYEKHLNKELLNPAAAACPALAASSNTTTTAAPSTKIPTAGNSTTTATKAPPTATPVSTTKAPASTTKAPGSATTPATTTKAPTASNATASNSTAAKTPAATTKAPTPSPSSGVSALSLSASAVVLAVAASFF